MIKTLVKVKCNNCEYISNSLWLHIFKLLRMCFASLFQNFTACFFFYSPLLFSEPYDSTARTQPFQILATPALPYEILRLLLDSLFFKYLNSDRICISTATTNFRKLCTLDLLLWKLQLSFRILSSLLFSLSIIKMITLSFEIIIYMYFSIIPLRYLLLCI